MTDMVKLSIYQIPKDTEYRLSCVKIDLEASQMEKSKEKKVLDDKILKEKIREQFSSFFFKSGMIVPLQYDEANIVMMNVKEVSLLELGVKPNPDKQKIQIKTTQEGIVVPETDMEFSAQMNDFFMLKSEGQKAQNIFRPDFKFDEMGVGGLDNELIDIFRRAFASRRFPSSTLKKYGIPHVKGVLLYGPPGTGKTLIARQLAKALKTAEPKVINGPEILGKYVGESEANIRLQFEDARKDQQKFGDASKLHIIIFDEIDAICKQRGSVNSGTGVHDTVVNQLLSMMDGVEALNNVLVIGMTNRKDMIDEALLRPGRFEVHIEVGLPDEKGRQDIFKIHIAEMKSNQVIDKEVDLKKLAEQTKNYTGAEILAVVKSATSFAFNRVHNILDFTKQNLEEEVIVQMNDFMEALKEVKPQFGVDTDKFENLVRNNLIDYGPQYQRIQTLIKDSIKQTINGKTSQLHTVLLYGEPSSGKTAIAAQAALSCNFPFIKLIAPENYVGYSEQSKINSIVKIFEDAYRSPHSCIILDNIERLIEYIDNGPRFSNLILQTLLILIKKAPKKENNRLLIIATTSQADNLRSLEIPQSFNLLIKIPNLMTPNEVKCVLKEYNISKQEEEKISQYVSNIPIKKLLMSLDMAISQVDPTSKVGITLDEFKDCYDAVAYNY